MDGNMLQEQDVNEYSGADGLTSENNIKPVKKQTVSAYKSYTAAIINKGKDFIDIDFKGFGIRVAVKGTITGKTVEVEYKGEIGKPDFECRML